MVNVIELSGKSGHILALACGQCHKVYLNDSRDLAITCCGPRQCSECEKPVEKNVVRCHRCRLRYLAGKATVDWERALHPVFDPSEDGGEWGDGWSSSVEALRQWCKDGEIQMPPYVFGSESHLVQIDPDDIANLLIDQMPEDVEFEDVVHDCDKLREYVLDWNKRQDYHRYEIDYSAIVVTDEAEFAKLMEPVEKWTPEAQGES